MDEAKQHWVVLRKACSTFHSKWIWAKSQREKITTLTLSAYSHNILSLSTSELGKHRRFSVLQWVVRLHMEWSIQFKQNVSSDEAHFQLDGYVNIQNAHYWSLLNQEVVIDKLQCDVHCPINCSNYLKQMSEPQRMFIIFWHTFKCCRVLTNSRNIFVQQ